MLGLLYRFGKPTRLEIRGHTGASNHQLGDNLTKLARLQEAPGWTGAPAATC
jgi:hypothetical protein